MSDNPNVAVLRELLDEYPAPNFTAERAALTAAIAALSAQGEAAPLGSDAVTDTKRLDFMERESLTVQAVAWPNGDAGDADVGWEVVEYSMTAPHVIRLGSGSTPREAIDAALAARTGKDE